MSAPEDIPEDREESFPCECGGSITKDEDNVFWQCDNCDFAKSIEPIEMPRR